MIQDTSFGKPPFVDAESKKHSDTNDQCCQDCGTRPRENASTKVESGQKQSQPRGKKSSSGKVESSKLLPKG
jgi:hypothetical protein